MQRHRNAGDDMHPLRFGVSAKIFCELRTAAVVKDKKPRVCEARGLERTGNLVRFHAPRKKILKKVCFSFNH